MPKEKKEKKTKEVEKKTTRIAGMEGGARIKDMSSTAEIVSELDLTAPVGPTKEIEKVIKQKIRGKAYQKAKSQIDKTKTYLIKEAVDLIKKSSYSKISGSLEIHLNLNQKGITGEVSLPHFQGKIKQVVIFDDKLIDELKSGKINFDVLLCSPANMPKLLAFAKLLGPKGLMPNPKNNTLVPDPEKVLKTFSTTALHFKSEKDFPLIHSVIGKLDQPTEELAENFKAFIKAVDQKNIKRAFIKSTMSPSVRVNI